MKYYATKDNDFDILEGAEICEFSSFDDLKEYLLRDFDKNDISKIEIVEGQFGDCWIKSHSFDFIQKIENEGFSIFKADQLSILRPGQHPGGNFYWINPVPKIFVAQYKKGVK